MHMVEELLANLVAWLELGAEALGVIIIGVGLAVGAYFWVRTMFSKSLQGYMQTRLTMSRFLVLALEFQLAADILATASEPSWEQLGRLGSIAVIRTFLNYFLGKEVREIEEEESAATSAAASDE